MPENHADLNYKPGSKVQYIKEKVQPYINEAEVDLTLWENRNSPEYKTTRRKITRKYYDRDNESQKDPLTGLFNRKGFEVRTQEEVARAKRLSHPLTAVLIDVNNLKQENDTNGHPAGDQLLKDVATVLKQSSRIYDVKARLGGDEYAVLLPELTPDQLTLFANTLADNMQNFVRPPSENQPTAIPFPLNAGIGYGTIDLGNVNESIRLIDAAMYFSKDQTKEAVKNVPISMEEYLAQKEEIQ